jgi:hypothetical protein
MYMRKWLSKFKTAFLKRTININLLAALKIPTYYNSQDYPESHIRCSVFSGFPFLYWSIFSSAHVLAGFRKNFQDHKQLSEKIVDTVYRRLPESRNQLRLEVTGRIFSISE